MKELTLLIAIFLLSLVVITPVQAGFWGDIFSGITKVLDNPKTTIKETKTTQQITKDSIPSKLNQGLATTASKSTKEKTITKEIDQYTQKSMMKSSKKALDDFVEQEYTKQYGKEKFSLANQKIVAGRKSKIRGDLWEGITRKHLCNQDIKCFDNYWTDARTAITNGARIENHFIVVGGKETNEFIKNHVDARFTKEPDFIEVWQENGRVTRMKIIDAKASTKEATKDSAQKEGFKQLCKDANLICEIEYAVPEESLSATQKDFVSCIGTGLLFGGLDPTDAVCLLPFLETSPK